MRFQVTVDRTNCGTLDHVYLSYLRDKGINGRKITWKQVVRDGWFGIVAWSLVAIVVPAAAGLGWLFVTPCAYLALSSLAGIVRLAMGHRIGCAAKHGFHWPLQLAELI